MRCLVYAMFTLEPLTILCSTVNKNKYCVNISVVWYKFTMQRRSSDRSDVEFSENHYIEYRPGTLNVILSVPHGGHLKPKHLPNRDFGKLVDGRRVFDHKYPKDHSVTVRTKADKFTKELATSLANVLEKKTGRRPHVIINHLHRLKLDCNCSQSEATFGVTEVVDAWKSYHRFIELAKKNIGKAGLYLDIHGHSHGENWIELGYLVPGRKLDTGDYNASETSIRKLHEKLLSNGHHITIQQLVSGPHSFGGLLSAIDGYSDIVVPSPRHPGPDAGQYFRGGFNVLRHGSRNEDGNEIDGIQIESPICRRMPAEREKYAEAVGCAVVEFLQLYYS